MLTKILGNNFSAIQLHNKFLTFGSCLYSLGRMENLQVPQTVDVMPRQQIAKIVDGPSSRMFITKQGRLYVNGRNKSGNLGKPALVQCISSLPLPIREKIVNAGLGQNHTALLTQSGHIYTLGSKPLINLGFLNQYIYSKSNLILGRKNYFDLLPHIIQSNKQFNQVAVGRHFTIALGKDHNLYGWGQHMGFCQSKPTIINQFKQICHKQHSHIKQIKACDYYFMVQLQNGSLYSWGLNEYGAGAGRKNQLIKDDVMRDDIFKVIDNFKGEKVIDYQLGQHSSVFLTENGKTYFSGLSLAFQPKLIPIPSNCKILSIAASKQSVAVSTDKGLYMIGQFINGIRFRNQQNYIMYYNKQIYQRIGGSYQGKWAVKQ